ncbi:MAG: AI-2E family transporter [Coriobacteriales bacterium]|nr:AI-2E family transporter [Coriobacteriales bacterium]
MPADDKLPDWVLESRGRWRSRFFTTWAIIGIGAILYFAGLILGRISGAIAPFVIAFVITFLLKGPVLWLSERFKISRALATLVAYVALFVVIGVLASLVSPLLGIQMASFAESVPAYIEQAEKVYVDLQAQYQSVPMPGWLERAVTTALASIGTLFTTIATGTANVVIAAGSGVVTALFDIILGLIVAFWLLKDLPVFVETLEEFAGPRYGDDLDQLIKTVNFTVGGYLKGQTIASLSTGFIAGIGLAIAGVPYALLLGVMAFWLNYVPYIGPFLTGLIAGVIALFHGPWWLALVAIGIVVAAQQLTDNLITPRVMSSQVDLHPTLVIFSLLVGGSLFGIVGLLFAIPVAATAKGLFMYYWDRREHHPLSGPSPLIVPEEAVEGGPPEDRS